MICEGGRYVYTDITQSGYSPLEIIALVKVFVIQKDEQFDATNKDYNAYKQANPNLLSLSHTSNVELLMSKEHKKKL